MRRSQAPERGDVVWLQFNPQAGHEQAGRRPAVVVSPGAYNRRVGLALFCPITSQVKGYPFEVALPTGLGRGRRRVVGSGKRPRLAHPRRQAHCESTRGRD